jgi:hypothetical protein
MSVREDATNLLLERRGVGYYTGGVLQVLAMALLAHLPLA